MARAKKPSEVETVAAPKPVEDDTTKVEVAPPVRRRRAPKPKVDADWRKAKSIEAHTALSKGDATGYRNARQECLDKGSDIYKRDEVMK